MALKKKSAGIWSDVNQIWIKDGIWKQVQEGWIKSGGVWQKFFSLIAEIATIYMGGNFTTISLSGRNYVGSYDLNSSVVTSWNPNASTSVYSLLVKNSTIYIGGNFTTMSSISRNRAASVDITSAVLNIWNPNANGIVYALESLNDRIYLGGAFTGLSGNSRLAHVDDISGVATSNVFVTDNTVYALQTSGSFVYAGGAFTNITGPSRNRFLAIDTDGEFITSFNPNAGGAVNAILVSGGTVYAGGAFTTLGGVTRNRVGAVDICGSLLEWNPNADGTVNALASYNNYVFLGGAFNTLRSISRQQFATVDSISGVTSGSAWYFGQTTATTRSIHVSGNVLYYGGDFTSIRGSTLSSIFSMDSDFQFFTTLNPRVASTVYTVFPSGDTIYFGGSFSTVTGQTRNRAAAVSIATESSGTLTSWNPNCNGDVRAMDSKDGGIFMVGGFATVGGLTRNGIACVNTTNGTASSWNISGSISGLTNMNISGSNIYVGGSTSSILFTPHKYLASIQKAKDELNPNFSATFNGAVYASLISGDNLYIGGTFTTVNSLVRQRLAAISVVDSSLLTWTPSAAGQVNAIVTSAGALYIGGAFSTMNFRSAYTRLCAVDMAGSIFTAWRPDPGNTVECIDLDISGNLYFGGSFTTISGSNYTRNRAAAVFVDPQSTIFLNWDPNCNNTVRAIVCDNSATIYLGGSFTTVGGSGRQYIAAVDTVNGAVTSFTTSANNAVYTLKLKDNNLYAGGTFTTINSTTRNYCARISHPEGTLTSWNPSISVSTGGIVYGFIIDNSKIHIGGFFSTTQGATKSGYVVVDDTTGVLNRDYNYFISNSINNTGIYTMSDTSTDIFVGGTFDGTGLYRSRAACFDADSGRLLRWNPRFGNTVNCIVNNENNMYIGGAFTTANEITRNRAAAVDPISGMLLPWHPSLNNTVQSMKASGSQIFIGGIFTTAQSITRNGGCSFDMSGTGNLSVWNPNLNPAGSTSLKAIETIDSKLYLGGTFYQINGTSIVRSSLVVVDSLSGTILPSSSIGFANGFSSQTVEYLKYHNGNVYAASNGTNDANTYAENYRGYGVAFDVTGTLLRWNPRCNNSIYAIASNNDAVIAGGTFTTVNGISKTRIAAFNPESGDLLTYFTASCGGTVQAIAISSDTIFLGGAFTTINSTTRNRAGAVDLSGNLKIWNPNFDNVVVGIKTDNGKVCLGGSFTTINSVVHSYTVVVDSLSGNALTSSNAYMGAAVTALDVKDGIQYIGGSMTTTSYIRNRGLTVDSSSSLQVWNPNCNGDIRTIAINGSDIYIGGSFTTVGGVTRNRAAKVDSGNGRVLSSWNPNLGNSVLTMAVSGERVYMGGSFTTVNGGTSHTGIAAFDVSGNYVAGWNPGCNNTVNTIVLRDAGVYFGGSFTTLRGTTRNYAGAVNHGTYATSGILTWNPNCNALVYIMKLKIQS